MSFQPRLHFERRLVIILNFRDHHACVHVVTSFEADTTPRDRSDSRLPDGRGHRVVAGTHLVPARFAELSLKLYNTRARAQVRTTQRRLSRQSDPVDKK